MWSQEWDTQKTYPEIFGSAKMDLRGSETWSLVAPSVGGVQFVDICVSSFWTGSKGKEATQFHHRKVVLYFPGSSDEQ